MSTGRGARDRCCTYRGAVLGRTAASTDPRRTRLDQGEQLVNRAAIGEWLSGDNAIDDLSSEVGSRSSRPSGRLDGAHRVASRQARSAGRGDWTGRGPRITTAAPGASSQAGSPRSQGSTTDRAASIRATRSGSVAASPNAHRDALVSQMLRPSQPAASVAIANRTINVGSARSPSGRYRSRSGCPSPRRGPLGRCSAPATPRSR